MLVVSRVAHRPLVSLLVAGFCAVGCQAPDLPTAEDGAIALGLQPGQTLTYQHSSGSTETHEFSDSDVLFGGGLAVDLQARQNGFAENDRTLSFGIDLEQASLVRFYDCLQDCLSPDQPIPFIGWPLTAGARVEGEATVQGREGGVDVVRTERHSTTVGDAVDVTVPAGTFSAFPVTWSRTRTDPATGESTTDQALLQWAPDVGVIKHETFDGDVLELSVAP